MSPSNQEPSGYPPGTPMYPDELESGTLPEQKFDGTAQIKLEKKRTELIDLLGRVVSWADPLDSEARTRLIDLNVKLAAERAVAARAAKIAAKYALKQSREASSSSSVSKKKMKQKEKDVDSCDELSDCSLPDEEFVASISPYIKETLQSSLNIKVQTINANCVAEGLSVPERKAAVCRAITELRDKIEDGAGKPADDEEEQLCMDIALKILDEFFEMQSTVSK